MKTPKTIHCPICKKEIIHYDGIATGVIDCKCRECNKLIVYYPMDDKIEMKNVPERTTGSGMRFF